MMPSVRPAIMRVYPDAVVAVRFDFVVTLYAIWTGHILASDWNGTIDAAFEDAFQRLPNWERYV